jgi:UDP-N-acetylmuramyl pentapeptide synthase
VIETKKQIHLVDDTYNANPGSMGAAIQTIEKIKGEHRGILVIGDMLELGKESAALHRKVGELVQISGMAALFATGRFAEDVARGAAEKGMSFDRIFIGDKEAICERLKSSLNKGDWVLIKGSRSMGMEKILHDIATWAGCVDNPVPNTNRSF